jgi:hypothetical protein
MSQPEPAEMLTCLGGDLGNANVLVMNSRRLTEQYLPCLERRDSTPQSCCAAGFRPDL